MDASKSITTIRSTETGLVIKQIFVLLIVRELLHLYILETLLPNASLYPGDVRLPIYDTPFLLPHR